MPAKLSAVFVSAESDSALYKPAGSLTLRCISQRGGRLTLCCISQRRGVLHLAVLVSPESLIILKKIEEEKFLPTNSMYCKVISENNYNKLSKMTYKIIYKTISK